MPKPPRYEADHDRTDELPALSGTTVRHRDGGSGDDFGWLDDTGQNTALFSAAVAATVSSSTSGAPNAAAADATIATLEAQVERWTARCRATEAQLAERDLAVAELHEAAAAARRLLGEHQDQARRSTAELAKRTAELATAEAEHARLRIEIEHLARQQPRSATVAQSPNPAAPVRGELEQLRDEYAALAGYVENRKQWWEGAQIELSQLTTKIVALKHELAVRDTRLAETEALASRESHRASEWRAEAAQYARLLRESDRAARPRVPEHPLDRPRPPSDVTRVPPSSTPPPDPVASEATHAALAERSEVVAQLEAEMEYKRHQVAAQLIELHERDERLQAVARELERVRAKLEAANAELEASRTAYLALERALGEKEREIAAREARIASLRSEPDPRLGALQKLSAMDVSLQDLEAKIAERLTMPTADEGVPTLLCLTGDAPQRIALRPATTFGRAPHCDVQILTHYVSREHARILLAADGATIEDLGSRNGVFVNAVKVERQRLRQGDLIKIGETQFRFVESVAH